MVHKVKDGVTEVKDLADNDSQQAPRRSLFARLRRYTPAPLSIDSSEANHPAGAPVVDLNDQSFFDALNDCVTVVDFWAPWCEPCKILQPRFDDIARSNADNPRLQFVRVNVDESLNVASAYNVTSIPTLVVFDQAGREIDREIGLPGKRRLAHLARDANAAAVVLNKRRTP